MTQKELLYLEDAIKHEDNIISLCEDFISMSSDDTVISFFNNQKSVHIDIRSNLYNTLEVKSNE